jgi:hypothetical protein
VKKLAGKIFRNKKGIEPVVATVIITGTIIALVTAATIFANNLLTASIAQGDFNSAKQYMRTVAMQIDDVAWQIGQTETVSYSSRYGTVTVLNGALRYTITLTNPTGSKAYTFNTGIIYFYMPVSYYSVSNNYFSQVWPSQVLNPINNGSTAPVATVFAVEKMPMSDGSYIRVVAAPVIRLINSTISTTQTTTYFLYLPVLSNGSSPRLSQSVTLKSNSISIGTQNDLISITVTVRFPISGFNQSFFNFPLGGGWTKYSNGTISKLITVSQSGIRVAQLFNASVTASLGANI